MRQLITFPIKVYRLFISPFLPQACRFYPSCSQYVQEAVECHGIWRGGLLGIKRLCSCHPWHVGGFDPVPEKATNAQDQQETNEHHPTNS
ncbi:MAG: membrane protein insertion efficiency factor YidD [Gammaproteobacteria bacterium]|nr:membrane protein insertion efficiency factor YidD [Gammaproteobacteria bacterium]